MQAVTTEFYWTAVTRDGKTVVGYDEDTICATAGRLPEDTDMLVVKSWVNKDFKHSIQIPVGYTPYVGFERCVTQRKTHLREEPEVQIFGYERPGEKVTWRFHRGEVTKR